MNKVYNEIRMIKLCARLNLNYNRLINEIYKEGLFKIIKRTSPIVFAEDIFNSCENKNEVLKKFFPLKYASLEGNFKTKRFWYNMNDEKLHWAVYNNEEDIRHFKLKTSNFEDRIPEELAAWKVKIKKEIDSLCGYWIYKDADTFIITDQSNYNGKPRVIAQWRDNYFYMNKNNFATLDELKTMHCVLEEKFCY